MTKDLASVNKKRKTTNKAARFPPTFRTVKYSKPAKSLTTKDYIQCTVMGRLIALIRCQ